MAIDGRFYILRACIFLAMVEYPLNFQSADVGVLRYSKLKVAHF